jgi:hexosaminidase
MTKKLVVILPLLYFLGSYSQVNSMNNLMPVPLKVEANTEYFAIDNNFRISIIGSPNKRIYAEASRFIRRLGERTGIFYDRQGFVTAKDNNIHSPLLLKIRRPAQLALSENEGYSINIREKQVVVESETDLGAIHALETLMQLVSTDEKGYYFPGMKINDEPRFAWRGLLLDVVLHFMPVDVVKRTLDGMAAVKMNVLHLHLSNDQGFRVESKVFPQLHLGAAEGKYYTQENIKEIIAYAGQRGIRIVPEFVFPAHTTAILTIYPELASVKKKYTLERYYGVFDPVMDPTNPKVYVFIDKLLKEMTALFPDKYFHIGGDENTGKDWQVTPHIRDYMKAKGMKNYMDLQTEFNRKLLPIVRKYGKTMMGWDEILQPGVPKDIVIQSWRGKEAFYESVKNGYRAILSHGYYIDLIQHADTHYLVDPIPDSVKMTKEETARVLGGEATMWSEMITPETVDSRIWPRLAVIAERLWSADTVRDVGSMYRRMKIVSLELESLGLRHMSYRPAYMRRLANSYDTRALEVLLEVIEPLKIYERNSGDTMYTVFSPFTKLADVAIPDPELPHIFNALTDGYLSSRTKENEKRIRDQLIIWKNNHQQYLTLVKNSPVLKEGEILSLNLSRIAASGLEALDYLQQGNNAPKEWVSRQLVILKNAREQGGRCDLQVIDPIEKLVLAASDENARMVPQFENTCLR